MIKWYNYEIILYYYHIPARIRIQGLLNQKPDWEFWLDLDPKSIEYGSETLPLWEFSKVQATVDKYISDADPYDKIL